MPGTANILTPETARSLRAESQATQRPPEQADAPASTSRGNPNRRQAGSDRAAQARARLTSRAKDFAEGQKGDTPAATDTPDRNTPPILRPRRAASEVSDSPAIAPSRIVPTPAAPTAQVQPETPAKEPTAEEKTAAAEKDKRIASAKRALARDGMKPGIMAKLDDEDILEQGEHAAKRQADNDREYARLRNAQGGRNPDGTFAPATTPPADDKADKGAAAPEASEMDAYLETIKDEIGEPGTKALKTIAKMLEAKYLTKANETASVTTEMLYSQGLDRVVAAYPDQLAAKPDAFDDVVENWKALVASGRYGRGQLGKAWDDAAHMQFGAVDQVTKSQRAMAARQAAARNGRVDPGTDTLPTTSAQPQLKGKDALNAAAKLLGDNKGVPIEQLRSRLLQRVRA